MKVNTDKQLVVLLIEAEEIETGYPYNFVSPGT